MLNQSLMAQTTMLDNLQVDNELKSITQTAMQTKGNNEFMKGSLQWEAWEKGLHLVK